MECYAMFPIPAYIEASGLKKNPRSNKSIAKLKRMLELLISWIFVESMALSISTN